MFNREYGLRVNSSHGFRSSEFELGPSYQLDTKLFDETLYRCIFLPTS